MVDGLFFMYILYAVFMIDGLFCMNILYAVLTWLMGYFVCIFYMRC